jgi:hypothetical protein
MRFSRLHDPRKIPADAQLGDQDPGGSSCLLTFALMSNVSIRVEGLPKGRAIRPIRPGHRPP